ncbi:MAG: S41 family peptidase [Bacteroidota bacterium]
MKISIALLSIFCLFSCTKVMVEPENTPIDNFEFIWQTINENFSLFEINEVRDWDEVYRDYAPQVSNQITEDSLFRVLNRMLLELKDFHTGIGGARLRFSYPFRPSQIDVEIVRQNYLNTAVQRGGILYTTLPDNIALARISTFSRLITEEDVIDFVEDIRDTDGLIFDIRSNGGGNEFYGRRIAKAFHDQERLYRTFFTKIGPERDALEEAGALYITPWKRAIYDKPVIILIDERTYSASSDFVLMMKGLPNVKLMGVHSGGGHGSPVGAQMPNGWQLVYSSSYSLDVNGVQVENGVSPDIKIALDTTQLANGIDNVIERAIQELK